jgi:hypothetical protein
MFPCRYIFTLYPIIFNQEHLTTGNCPQVSLEATWDISSVKWSTSRDLLEFFPFFGSALALLHLGEEFII